MSRRIQQLHTGRGFTLLEIVVALAVAGLFIVMVTGVLQSSVSVARTRQVHSQGRAGTRFALDLIGTELAEVGARIPPRIAFYAPDTVNNSADAAVADLGTDTLTLLRSRSGGMSVVMSITGATPNFILTMRYHTADTTGEYAICQTAEKCVAAFEIEHGGQGGHVALTSGLDTWIMSVEADPTAALGAGGSIRLVVKQVATTPGAGTPTEGAEITGVEVRSFRIMDETLEMKEGFFASPDEFMSLVEGIEDLQVGWVLADGSFVNTGIPAQVENIRGTAISLVAVDPEDMTLGGDEFFVRPAAEDHAVGTETDRRRRTVRREIYWARNLSEGGG